MARSRRVPGRGARLGAPRPASSGRRRRTCAPAPGRLPDRPRRLRHGPRQLQRRRRRDRALQRGVAAAAAVRLPHPRSTLGVGDDWPLSYAELAPVLRGDRPPVRRLRARAATRRIRRARIRRSRRCRSAAPGLRSPAPTRGSAGTGGPSTTRSCPPTTTAATRACSVARAGRGATKAPRARPTSPTGPVADRAPAHASSPARACAASRSTAAAARAAPTWLDADGHEHFQAADVVLCAANGIGTARLLLLSAHAARARRPRQLVGARRPTAHGASRSDGRRLLRRRPARAGRATSAARSSRSSSAAPIPTAASSAARSGAWRPPAVRSRSRSACAAAARCSAPSTTSTCATALRARRALGRALRGPAPTSTTASSCRPTLVDGSGIPAPEGHLPRSSDDVRRAIGVEHRARHRVARSKPVRAPSTPLSMRNNSHLLGTARMGDDPRTSVVDRVGHDARRPQPRRSSTAACSSPSAPPTRRARSARSRSAPSSTCSRDRGDVAGARARPGTSRRPRHRRRHR